MAGTAPNQPPDLNLGWIQPGSDGSQQMYDEQGYPLPTQDQTDAYNNTRKLVGDKAQKNPNWDQLAYDPSLPAPKPSSENPYPIEARVTPDGKRVWTKHDEWEAQQSFLRKNQEQKQKWQQAHAAQRKPQESTTQPFASAGIDLTKEGKGESYADSVINYYGEHGVPKSSNEAQVTLDRFRASQPQDLSPYYDYASKLTSAKIDNAMSARGSYGSSNATGQIGAAEMALRADEAKANAQYGLDRFAQEGNFAGSADASSARNNALEFEWAKGLSDLAFKSQTAGQDRNQQLFDNNKWLAAAKAGNYTDATNKAIEGVGQATDAANNVSVGSANDKVSGANTDANVSASHASSIQDSANKFATNYYNYSTNKDEADYQDWKRAQEGYVKPSQRSN